METLIMERTSENACKHIVSNCADLKSNESALIISDQSTSVMGDLLEKAALEITPIVTHKTIPAADMHGKEPPSEIAELMKQSDVIFGITKMSMAHTMARYNATSLGSRYLSLPDYTLELLTRPAIFVDYRAITRTSRVIANLMTKGLTARITSSLGTDLRLNLAGRVGNVAPGWCYEKGSLASPPDAEANIPPIEDGTEGILVVDGSIPCRELGLLTSPISLIIHKGKITQITGKNADILESVLNKHNTDATRVAAEFGIGLNPAAELIGSMLEDEGCLGTIHIGFGSNSTIGGKNKVPFHLDMIVRNATVWIDDTKIMENGIMDKRIQLLESEVIV